MSNSMHPFVKQICALLVSASVTVTAMPLPAGAQASFAPRASNASKTSAALLPVPKVVPKALSGSHSAPDMKRKLSASTRPGKSGLSKTALSKVVQGAKELTFIENKGQFDKRAKFQVSSGGHTLWLTDNSIIFDCLQRTPAQVEGGPPPFDMQAGSLSPDSPATPGNAGLQEPAVGDMERHVIYQDFVGVGDEPFMEARGVQPGTHNYLSGSDPSKWQTQVHGFSEVVYHDVWKGVDLRLYGDGPDLEQEFIVHPGADVSQVRVAYKGIDRLEIAKDGSLVIRTAAGQMRETPPRLYQEISGRRVAVKGKFKLLSATSYTFEVSGRDAKHALVIDPTLLYSTFLGGSAGNNIFTTGTHETATGIAVDQAGNAYVTGFTGSGDFPTTPGVFQTTNPGGQQTFVTKLNAAGNALVYSTYLNASFPSAIAVDLLGNAYVAGSNTHAGFATTANAYSESCGASGGLPFLTVLNPLGSGLVYSTCFGTGGLDGAVVSSMVATADGRAYITGTTDNPNFPTTASAYQPSYPGVRSSAFVIAFDTNLSGTASLAYSTFFGIQSTNFNAYGTMGNGIGVDSFGNIYITGYAGDSLPVTPGAFQTDFATGVTCNPFGGAIWVCPDAFVAKLNPSASGAQSLIYATYLGGPGTDIGNAIAVDGSGNAYVAGTTQSESFPVTPGAFQTASPGQLGAANVSFVSKLNAAGSNLLYSTYLGPVCATRPCIQGPLSANAIALDGFGDAYVVGYFRALTITFPTTPDAFQNSYAKLSGDFSEAFLTKLNSTGSGLVYSSYLGGEGDDVATAIAIDQAGDAYIAGHTTSLNFPITVGSFQTAMHGTGDAFVSKFPLGAVQALSITSVSPNTGGNVGTVTARIVGGGFHSGATVNLVGDSTIASGSTFVGSEGRTIDATFDLTGALPGAYSVTVINPDGTSISQAHAFAIQQGGGPQLSVSIVGRSSLVIEQGSASTTFDVLVSNTGNSDAVGVVISLYGIPADAFFSPLFEITPVPTSAGTSIDFSQAPFAPIIGQEQIPTLLVPMVPVAGSVVLPFRIGISSLPSTPPLSPKPPQGAAARFAAPSSSLQITAVASVIQDFCTVSVTPLDCATSVAKDIALIVKDVPGLGNLLSIGDCLHDIWCLRALSVLQGAGLMTVNRPTVLNMYQLLLQLLVDCSSVVTPPNFKLASALNDIASLVLDLEKCILFPAKSTASLSIVASLDPNDKKGITGIGPSNWLSGSHQLFYSIYFLNEPTATAAARTVAVTDALDASIDLSTFRMNGIVIGGMNMPFSETISPRLGQYHASSTMDVRPTQSLLVNADVSLDPVTRTLTWQFAAIDPMTGLPPDDPTVGVLPPGVEGSVAYSAKPLQTLATGTSISNQATVVFDGNAAINTPTWVNTIDNVAPSSHVVALPTAEPASGFSLSWTGEDVGAGIQDFTIFVSDNGGPFTPFQTNTTATSATFVGQVGHTYGFYSIARDLVGNVEAAKTTAEATTLVATDTIPPTTTASISPGPNANGWNKSDVTITLTSVDNPGGTGVKEINYSASGAQSIAGTTAQGATASITISSEGATTITFFATDNAGNVETANTLTVKLDKTPPTILGALAPPLNASGWTNTDVTVSFTCTDALSGLAAGSPPAPTTLSAEGANQSVSGTCQDLAGNSASASVSGINIDKTPPTVACSASPNVLWPPDNKLVPVNAAVTVTDSLSGPAGFNLLSVASSEPDSGLGDIQDFVTGTPSVSGQLRAQRLGSENGRVYTFNYSAGDRAGNSAACTTTASVPHDQAP